MSEMSEMSEMSLSVTFPHHRFDAYRVALEMATEAKAVADRVPRGYRSVADHLVRSAGSTVLLIAEGASRFGRAQKRQRYQEARGECGEAAAAVELLLALGLVPRQQAQGTLELAARVGAMLTRLVAGMG